MTRLVRALAADLGVTERELLDALYFAIPGAALAFIVIVALLVFGMQRP